MLNVNKKKQTMSKYNRNKKRKKKRIINLLCWRKMREKKKLLGNQYTKNKTKTKDASRQDTKKNWTAKKKTCHTYIN